MAKPRNTVYLVEVAPDEIKSFSDWPTCQGFVKGKPYAFAGGVDHSAALAKLMRTRDQQKSMRQKGPTASGQRTKAPTRPGKQAAQSRPSQGITSDCGTHGNPGPCEYQVTDLQGKRLKHQHLGVHTNNFAELAGIEAMISVALDMKETVLWTDSLISMGWIKSGKLGTSVREPELIFGMLNRIRTQLHEHPELKLKKWDTRNWGQIPSDFGRK